MTETPKRAQLVLQRWLDVLFAGMVGAAVILLLLHWRRRDVSILVELPPWILVAARPPAQAVVGRLGAGKTTLCNLVKEAVLDLGGGRRVRVVSIALWPYETSRAAVEGVIRELVDALADEVNVVGLRGLASAYAEAMTASGGWLAGLVRIQGVPTRPLDSLKAIDDVATAIGIRYVVWIEDLERFAGVDTSEASEEKLNPIRALLYGLDQLNSITVVTATTTLRMRFDIEKIARYVEALPELAGPQVGKILDLFRTGCLRAPDLIDPATPESREQLNVLQHSEIYAIRRLMWGREIHDAADALLTLCVAPRAIKQALRACLDTWTRLRGEIDFDDALVLCVIRETQPAAFAIIQDHIQYLRRGRRAREEEQRTAQAAWESALGALPMDDRQRAAVRYLVEFVFGERNAWRKPQGPTEHQPSKILNGFFRRTALCGYFCLSSKGAAKRGLTRGSARSRPASYRSGACGIGAGSKASWLRTLCSSRSSEHSISRFHGTSGSRLTSRSILS